MQIISSIIAISPSSVKLASRTLPKVQKTTSAIFELSAKYSINATTPPKNIAIAIPERIIVVALKFLNFEIAKIKRVGIKANINAQITITTEDPATMPEKQTIAMQAPHDAPCETPIVEGAAKGFPKLLCKTQPQIPKIAPAISEHKTCGSLNSKSTRDS